MALPVIKVEEKTGIYNFVNPLLLRSSFSTYIVEQRIDIGNIQKLPGHSTPKTTILNSPIRNISLRNIKSPLDWILEDKLNINNELNKGQP